MVETQLNGEKPACNFLYILSEAEDDIFRFFYGNTELTVGRPCTGKQVIEVIGT